MEPTDDSKNLRSSSLILSKSEAPWRYFTMPGGCVSGHKCLFSHPDAEVMSVQMGQSFMPNQVGGSKRIGAEDLCKKIFVGGLSPSVESDDLREFFEANYGPVLDAVVIGSQAGDQMQSRGFGFVTFKHAESVAAAVEAHYTNIYGKQVEMKGAFPRSELPPLEVEVSRGDSGTPSDSQPAMYSGNRVLDLDEADVLEVATPGSLCLPKNDELSQCDRTSSAMAEPQQESPPESMSSPTLGESLPSGRASNASCDSISGGAIREASSESAASTSHGLPAPAKVSNVPHDTYSRSVMRAGGPSSRIVPEREPAWLNSFKQWLPGFLTRVSMRLKGGEWYPLSSLKGDYRAICGLELDHVSLGFDKLSDFIRSFPELCRMKIVPVGRGPATHMVLLPPHPRPHPLVVGGRRNLSNITSGSLVDGTRSYAEVACHGAAARPRRPDTVMPSSNPGFCSGSTNLGRPGTVTGVPLSSGGLISSAAYGPPISDRGLPQGLLVTETFGARASYAAAAGYNAGLISTTNGPLRTSITPEPEEHSRSDSSNCTTVSSNSSSSSRCRLASHETSAQTDHETETWSAGEISSDVDSGLSKEDLELLQELVSRLKKTEKEHVPARNHVYQPSLSRYRSKAQDPGCQAPQKLMKNIDNEGEICFRAQVIDQEPKTPTCGSNYLTTPFNHPFAGFLPETFPRIQACGAKT